MKVIEFETMERRILIPFLHNDKSKEVEVFKIHCTERKEILSHLISLPVCVMFSHKGLHQLRMYCPLDVFY